MTEPTPPNPDNYRKALADDIANRRVLIGEQTDDQDSPIVAATVAALLDHVAHLEYRMAQVLDRLDLWGDEAPEADA